MYKYHTQTGNQKHHIEGNAIPAGYNNAPVSGVNNYLNSKHTRTIRTPLSVLLHGTALCTDGLAHQLVVICYVVRSGIHVLWKT